MKKILLTLLVGLVSLSTNALSYNLWYDGVWHGWDDFHYSVSGTYDDLIFYYQADGISHYMLRITINGFWVPDKKTMKECIKNNQWLNYKGTVEYYVCDDYPSAYDIWTKRPHYYSGLLHNSLNLIYWNYHDDQWNKRPVKRVKMQADIRIAPFKKSPKTYNVYWENVGLGITVD